jgi:hypothetical protein
MSINVITEEPREIPVLERADVVVAGGGPAGLGAAVGAAREGAKTMLIERNAFLGGTATAGLMANFMMDADHTTGFTKELVDRLVSVGGAKTGRIIIFDPEAFKEIALEYVTEAGVQPLLYTVAARPYVKDGEVRGIFVENKSGRQVILADVTIDTSGDADLAFQAGAPWTVGREEDQMTRPMTVLFRLGNVDVREMVQYAKAHPDQFSRNPNSNVLDIDSGVVRLSGFYDLVEEARKAGQVDKDCHYLRFEGVSVENNTVIINTTRVYDLKGSDAMELTQAELEGRAQMKKLVTFIRRKIPGCSKAFLVDASANIGVRETRRIIGEYVLGAEDVSGKRSFPDTIAHIYRRHVVGRDMHSPDRGEGGKEDAGSRDVTPPLQSFEIPYRCLIPKKVDNLLVAGRAMSTTHIGDTWTRGMYCAIVAGQAAGIAAALASADGAAVRDLDIEKLQGRLSAQGIDLGKVRG